MKHTGTIEIDCNVTGCGDCNYRTGDNCELFFELLYLDEEDNERCPQCLATFTPEISEGKVRQIMAGGSGIEDIKKALESK